MGWSKSRFIFICFVLVLLAACGGNNSSTAPDTLKPQVPPVIPETPPVTNAAAPVSLYYIPVKGFRFEWNDVEYASHYRLLENQDGISGFNQVGADISVGSEQMTLTVPLYERVNAEYILQSCDAKGCIDSDVVSVSGNLAASVGYFKASNTGTGDEFGSSVALSADGKTLAVSAEFEASGATSVNGDQLDNSAPNAGAVYIFSWNDVSWIQQAYLKASNSSENDFFGSSVSISDDGNTLVVGARYEASNATGVDGNQLDDSAPQAGAVYVFNRSGSLWTQQAYLKASNADEYSEFGGSISLSADGGTLAVGAQNEMSDAIGVNGVPSFVNVAGSGAVYVFIRTTNTWTQEAYIKASNPDMFDFFGHSVSLSANGNTLAVGAYGEDSNAIGVNGDQFDDSADWAGAVYLFTRDGIDWAQQAYVKASNDGGAFGSSVSLSADGNTLAVAAVIESSNAVGVNGDQSNTSAPQAGAVYVLSRSGITWAHQVYLKAGSTDTDDGFGSSVSLSADGNSLAVGVASEDGSTIGLDGEQTDNNAPEAGAVYVFSRKESVWSQQSYVKASNTSMNQGFGSSVSLSADGYTLAVGAKYEDSNSTGVDASQSSISAPNAGSLYIY